MDINEMLRDVLSQKQRVDYEEIAKQRNSESIRNEIMFMFAGNRLVTAMGQPQNTFAKLVETYLRNPIFSQALDGVVETMLQLFPTFTKDSVQSGTVLSMDRPREVRELQ